MEKISSKKLRIIWCSIITSGLLIPTVAVSAIACSPEIKPIDKNKIILNTKPVNGTLFLNQDENLPVLSVEAKVDNPNASDMKIIQIRPLMEKQFLVQLNQHTQFLNLILKKPEQNISMPL